MMPMIDRFEAFMSFGIIFSLLLGLVGIAITVAVWAYREGNDE